MNTGRERGRPAGLARHRAAALGLQLAHIAWFWSTLDAAFDAAAMTISGVASAALYAVFLFAEYRWNEYRVTPILFYLAAGVFRLGAGTLFIVAAVMTEEWGLLEVGVYDVSGFLMHGHWVTLVGDWCFVAGYVGLSSLGGRRFHAPACVSPILWGRVGRAGLVTAVTGLALRFAERYVGFGGLDSLVGYVQSYGPAAGVYLMLLASRRGGRGGTDGSLPRAGLAYVLLGLDLADGFFSYMKAPLLVAILPLVLIRAEQGPAGRRSGPGLRPFRPAAAVLLAAYFFLFVVSSYSEARRPAFWEFGAGPERADPYDVPVAPYLAPAVLGAIPGTAEFRDTHRFPNGVWELVGRMSLTPVPAWIYQRVASAGFRGDGFFENLLAQVTPRAVWPGKPVVATGRDFAVAIGEAPSFDQARSSVAMTMQGAYYWWAGYVGLVLGCAASGAAFAGAWLLFRNQLMLNPASAIAVLVLCHEGFRWFESALLGGFPMYLYLVIVFAPLQIVLRRVTGYRLVRGAGDRQPA